MIKTVIFDMDGLLIDSERAMWVPNEKKSLQEMGYEIDEHFLLSLMGGARSSNEPQYIERYGKDFDVDRYYELLLGYNSYYIENGLIPLKDGAKELIEYLLKEKIHICLGTSSPKDYATTILKANGVYDAFDQMVTRNDVVSVKPAPDIYLKCASLYDCDKSEMIVLEDAHNGALAAHRAGIRCIIIPDLATLTDWDKENCTLLPNLKDVIQIIEDSKNGN